MASFYWYENDKNRLAGELAAMKKFYPHFKLGKLSNGRLYWQGKLQPFGKGGTIWEVRLIYPNSYPYMAEDDPGWGGAIDTQLIGPKTLEDIIYALNVPIPHVYKKGSKYYVCTVSGKKYNGMRGYTNTDGAAATTACQTVAWLVKWLSLFEMCLNGELTFEEMGQDGNF